MMCGCTEWQKAYSHPLLRYLSHRASKFLGRYLEGAWMLPVRTDLLSKAQCKELVIYDLVLNLYIQAEFGRLLSEKNTGTKKI